MNFLKDVRTGALPAREIPGFMMYLVRRNWPVIAAMAITVYIMVIVIK